MVGGVERKGMRRSSVPETAPSLLEMQHSTKAHSCVPRNRLIARYFVSRQQYDGLTARDVVLCVAFQDVVRPPWRSTAQPTISPSPEADARPPRPRLTRTDRPPAV